IHKGEDIHLLCRRCRRIRLEALPAYSSELNPDEGVWNQTRAALSNIRPNDPAKLTKMLCKTMAGIRASPRKLRWCFHQSELPPFL
ncbi:MAG: transposase, partial [Deltaproteobacteria bacterium]|nr:transposase [Deltaproteobacteria bacterium]